MQTIDDIGAMQAWADQARRDRHRIGFVPTMGYLHEGHLSLVRLARTEADRVVASIFVNPLQFGADEDLDNYPRAFGRDAEMLEAAGADVLFFPPAEQMYPDGYQTAVTVERVSQALCGASRPVHFRGVATVVTKLFHIVKPHVAVFGKKDFQQWVVIRRMTADLNFDIEILGGPIVREPDGLAMSSRNAYLSPVERGAALCLARALQAAQAAVAAGETSAATIRAAALHVISAEPLARLDYAELMDVDTIEPVERISGPTLLALAVHIGRTRLIDNCVLRDSH
ncbi:MAG TPA: pantoate--beta-alanine ligase [Terriglobales bacterium]|nr:pantoate--beta-alanine ligase [Terriglobales bacterium]